MRWMGVGRAGTGSSSWGALLRTWLPPQTAACRGGRAQPAPRPPTHPPTARPPALHPPQRGGGAQLPVPARPRHRPGGGGAPAGGAGRRPAAPRHRHAAQLQEGGARRQPAAVLQLPAHRAAARRGCAPGPLGCLAAGRPAARSSLPAQLRAWACVGAHAAPGHAALHRVDPLPPCPTAFPQPQTAACSSLRACRWNFPMSRRPTAASPAQQRRRRRRQLEMQQQRRRRRCQKRIPWRCCARRAWWAACAWPRALWRSTACAARQSSSARRREPSEGRQLAGADRPAS